jgi:hypothetical protein
MPQRLQSIGFTTATAAPRRHAGWSVAERQLGPTSSDGLTTTRNLEQRECNSGAGVPPTLRVLRGSRLRRRVLPRRERRSDCKCGDRLGKASGRGGRRSRRMSYGTAQPSELSGPPRFRRRNSDAFAAALEAAGGSCEVPIDGWLLTHVPEGSSFDVDEQLFRERVRAHQAGIVDAPRSAG